MRTRKNSGFTLIELAVVIFLIGILASMGIVALKAQLASAAISATKKKQDTIKDALITYLGHYKRLPCPAIDNTGVESRVTTNTPANCTGNFGLVPYATLGLPKSAGMDGWENFYSYGVSPQWTLTLTGIAPVAGGTSTNVSAQAFNVGIAGVLTIKDRTPATNAVTTTISSNAVAVLISHGKDGLGAFTSKGTQNVLPANTTDQFSNVTIATWAIPATFYQREYTDVDVPTYGAFDDTLQWFSASDLTTTLLKDGILESAEAQWADQVTNIKNAIFSYLQTNGNCSPPTNAQFVSSILTPNNIPSTDPWGHTIEYVQCVQKIRSDTTTLTAGGIPGAQFLNQATGFSNTYSNYCTNPQQLAYAITTITNTSTTPITKLPIPTPTITALFSTYSNFMNNQCP